MSTEENLQRWAVLLLVGWAAVVYAFYVLGYLR